MYKFIDTNEYQSSSELPSEALQINGEYIENLIPGYRTLNVSGREALSKELDCFETGVRDGSKIKHRRYPARTITVTYKLTSATNEDFRDAYNKLGGILNCENAELIFNDEPDKFFTGTPMTIGEVEPGRNAVIGEIEFLCVDPFKYSVVEYEAEPTLDENSVLIDYNGTYKSFPTLEADFFDENEASDDGETVNALTGSGDCGYVAFFNEDERIIQLGDPEEADGENTYAKSQTLICSDFDKSTSWGAAAKSQWTVNGGVTSGSDVVQAGSIGMGIASYAAKAVSADTSATLLTATSNVSPPPVDYKISAKATGRTPTSVKVNIAITAALGRDTSYFLSGYILKASVYIAGSWHDVTLKQSSDKWSGRTGHTVNISVTVSGLSTSQSSITGIKFKAWRGDSYGDGTGVLAETACKNMPISQYVSPEPDSYYLTPTGFGTGDKWHGPSITRAIPADAAGETGAVNWTLSYSQKMSIGPGKNDINQIGAFQVFAVSGSGTGRKIVAGVNVCKGSAGKKAKLRFYINGSVVKTEEIDLSYNNKYFKAGNTSTITKSGQTVTFNICGIKRTFTDSAISDAVVKQITFTMTKYGSKTALAYNGLYSAKFVKNNCTTWRDIPNKFSAGDVVEADCKYGKIYLNGVDTPNLGALGNDWENFYLTPGLNQIGFSCSEWVADGYKPNIKIRYREVFL